MKLPRDLSGADLIKMLCKHHGYQRLNQEGSHVILETETPQHHRVAVPNHAPIRIGTLNAILNAVARAKGISKAEVLSPQSGG
jgi:predicted RNA binding protein YcfA (HicA-like mRNA interferase family)